MGGGSIWKVLAGGTAVIALAVPLVPALGQETGGPLLTFDVSTRLEADDNPGLAVTKPSKPTILSETRLTFGAESVTRGQSLRLSLSDTFRFGDGPAAPVDADFVAPQITLSYSREVPNAVLDLSASLQTRDLDGDIDEDDVLANPAVLTEDQGTLTTRRIGALYETGRTDPLGLRGTVNWVGRDYQDTTDPDLFDSETLSFGATVFLRPNGAGGGTEYSLSYDRSLYQAEDAVLTERETQTLTLGFSGRIDAATVLSARAGWTEIDETLRLFPLTVPGDSGLNAGLTLSRELANGSAAISLDRSVTSAGDRTDLDLARSLETPTGALDLSLGLTQVAGGDLLPTAGVSYTLARPSQSLSLGLSTGISVSDDADLQRTTTLDVGYRYEISALDALTLDLGYTWVGDAEGGTAITDVGRATLTAGYSRALTEDWSLNSGYTYRSYDEEGAGTATSNTLFVTLGRSFSWRP